MRSKSVAAKAVGTSGAQRGAVLVLSLVILMVMTLIGVTAIQRTTLDEKMAGNLRDRTLAFEAAESALREAGAAVEDWHEVRLADMSASDGVFAPGTLDVSPESADLAGDGGSVPAGMTPYDAFPEAAFPPRYAVEEVAFVPDDLSPESRAKRIGVYYYSVTALGFGTTGNSKAMVQAVFDKRFN